MKALQFLLFSMMFALILLSCAVQKTEAEIRMEELANNLINSEEPIYLAHNLWQIDDWDIEAMNIKSKELVRGNPVFGNVRPGSEIHMIPAGTAIEYVMFDYRYRGHGVPAPYILFKVREKSKYDFLGMIPKYQKNNQREVSIEELLVRTFTTKTFDELTAGMKPEEIENIRNGTIQKGMSRDAVIVSWGYPPLHANPSLSGRHLYYWKNYWVKELVDFDENDRVLQSTWYGTEGNSVDVIE